MPTAFAAANHDPLSNALWRSGLIRHPTPLKYTNYEVDIRGGLAIVTETRTFENTEERSIEATLTFPVPIHAAVFDLKVLIAGRELTSKAKAKSDARSDYETAIDDGKLCVLHEEVLRGVHMLSVGQLPAGETAVVTSVWACALTWAEGRAQLRIPTTVGEVYGLSPLPDSDDLVSSGPVHQGSLSIRCQSGTAMIDDTPVTQAPRDITLDAPIDIEVPNFRPMPLYALDPDDRALKLTIEPARAGDAQINASILVDHSGSMSDSCAGGTRVSKHEAAVDGLREAARYIPTGSRLEFWEFDDRVDLVGTARSRKELRQAITMLTGPEGGTEIGGALLHVAERTHNRDILLITDGQSYALDVLGLAKLNRRVSVVLVGEDSLEANVGHLAALTGGEIFVALGGDVERAIVAAMKSLRRSVGERGLGEQRR